MHEANDQASRAAFKPHAIIITERSVPSPIFVAAVLGVDRLLRIDFDLSRDPSTFVSQALSGLNQKVQRWGSSIPAFGKPTGFVINYTFDRQARFDLDGKLVELKGQHQELGEATLNLSGGKSLADASHPRPRKSLWPPSSGQPGQRDRESGCSAAVAKPVLEKSPNSAGSY